MSAPPCTVITPPLPSPALPALSASPCLSAFPCFVIILLPCQHLPALLSSSCSVSISLPFSIPLLCYHPSTDPAMSASPCSVTILLLCQYLPAFQNSLLCYHPSALSASPRHVSIPLLCYHPFALSASPCLSAPPCSVIILLPCQHLPAVTIPMLCYLDPVSV